MMVAERPGSCSRVPKFLGCALAIVAVPLATASAQVSSIELLSKSTAGTLGTGDSVLPAISSNGAFVAFATDSVLEAGDTGFFRDVYVRDVANGTTTRIKASVSTEGNSSSAPGLGAISISADGRYVAFASDATNFIPNDTNGSTDVFRYDRQTGTFQAASVNSSETLSTNGGIGSSMSADGSTVLFVSMSQLDGLDTNLAADVYARDFTEGVTFRVSAAPGGGNPNNSAEPEDIALSPDGTVAAYISDATNLVANDTNGQPDLFVVNLATLTTVRASTSASGTAANGPSHLPALSLTGKFVAFSSEASNLVPNDTNGATDVFVKDTQTGEIELVSVDTAGVQADNASGFTGVSISSSGRYVLFDSIAANLNGGETSHQIFVRDRTARVTYRISEPTTGAQPNGTSRAPRTGISETGLFVFESFSSNLGFVDTNSASDVFAVTLRTAPVPTPTPTPGPLVPGTKLTEPPLVTAGGKTAVVTLKPFTGVQGNKPVKPKLTLRYLVTIVRIAASGVVKQASFKVSKTSKKPTVTFKGVPPGSYSVSYRAQAVSGGKVKFQSGKSPSQNFSLP